jgi:hypothetical protein
LKGHKKPLSSIKAGMFLAFEKNFVKLFFAKRRNDEGYSLAWGFWCRKIPT